MGEELNALLELWHTFNDSPCKFLVFSVPNRLHKVVYLKGFDFYTGRVHISIKFWNEEDISLVKNQYSIIEFARDSLIPPCIFYYTPNTVFLRLDKNLLC